MKLTNVKKNSGFTLVELLVVIAIIAGLAAISSPIILRQIARSRATQAINNGKDIYIGLRDYAFANTQMPAPDDTSSNLCLADVFVQGYIKDEKPFFVAGVIHNGGGLAIPGDENITTGNELEALSNVYTYWGVTAAGGIDPTSSSASAPVLSVPTVTVPGAYDVATYDTTDFAGQAVVVTADGAAVSRPIVPADSTIDVENPTVVGTTTVQATLGVLPLE
jgi:prepilin-type N-terminal cleavage/methylation domain-containing protein